MVSLTIASNFNYNFVLKNFNFETTDHKITSNILCSGTDQVHFYFAPDFTKELNLQDWFSINSKRIQEKLNTFTHITVTNLEPTLVKKPLNGQFNFEPYDYFQDFINSKGQVFTIMNLNCATKDGKQVGSYTITLLNDHKYYETFALLFDNSNGPIYRLISTSGDYPESKVLHVQTGAINYLTLNSGSSLKLYKKK
ncbi:Uncharacterised protein [uncultured archaeon]|nr:Uncharacterised protein [uncultured archaeon]